MSRLKRFLVMICKLSNVYEYGCFYVLVGKLHWRSVYWSMATVKPSDSPSVGTVSAP